MPLGLKSGLPDRRKPQGKKSYSLRLFVLKRTLKTNFFPMLFPSSGVGSNNRKWERDNVLIKARRN